LLQAKTKHGTLVTPSMLTKREINTLKQEGTLFYCPTCNKRVIMKAGFKMIAHFAHHSRAACPAGEAGEGIYHEKGKLILYQWLKKQAISVQLEFYLPEIRQRPDLLVRIGKKKIAVEYQCASIPANEVVKRTAGYQSAGITPIWVLGSNWLERINNTHFRLNQQLLPFIHQFSPGTHPALFFFSGETSHFISIHDIYLAGKTKAMGKFSIRKLEQLSFKDLFKEHVFSSKTLYTLWEREKYRFRLRPSGRLYGQELAWHQWLYQKGFYREVLPAVVYLPVSDSFKMKLSPWDWQSRLLLDIIDPMAAGTVFSSRRAHQLLRPYHFPPHLFPLNHSNSNPVHEYLYLLSRINIIRQGRDGNFLKVNPVPKPQSMEEAMKADKQLLHFLSSEIK